MVYNPLDLGDAHIIWTPGNGWFVMEIEHTLYSPNSQMVLVSLRCVVLLVCTGHYKELGSASAGSTHRINHMSNGYVTVPGLVLRTKGHG